MGSERVGKRVGSEPQWLSSCCSLLLAVLSAVAVGLQITRCCSPIAVHVSAQAVSVGKLVCRRSQSVEVLLFDTVTPTATAKVPVVILDT